MIGITKPGTTKRADFADLAIATACALALTATALFFGVLPASRHLTGSRDFVVYWATGQQLIHHGNPFDAAAMGAIEHGAGFTGKGSFYMRNPPWSLPLALPLGLVSARVAALPWSLLMLAILIASVRILWKMFGQPGNYVEWLGYCFPPALICVLAGQTSLFVLLGLVLFLRFHASRPFWAGAALWLCTLKPHLFLVFGVVLIVWIVVTRSYRIVAGAAAALAVSCALTELIDPAAWSQYLHWAGNSGIANQFIPCLSVMLRDAIDPEKYWLGLVPALVACVWALIYYWQRRSRWDWLEHGNLVMLVSIFVAPYCWIWDHSLAIPALLYGGARTRSRLLIGILGVMVMVLQLQPYVFSVGLDSKLFLWPAPAWLVWYLCAQASWRLKGEPVQSATAPVASAG
jgi:hypothetical protein